MIPGTPHVTQSCAAATELFIRIGDKWTLIVVRVLWDRAQRFSEIRRAVCHLTAGADAHAARPRARRAGDTDGDADCPYACGL